MTKRPRSLILPNTFRATAHQPSFQYNTSPSFVILDISTIDFHFDDRIGLYKFYPPRAIVETVSSIPVYSDYDWAVIGEIEHRLTEADLDKLDFDMVDLLVSNVVTWFYEYLNIYLPDNVDSYVFDRWLDMRHNELVMKRHDLY